MFKKFLLAACLITVLLLNFSTAAFAQGDSTQPVEIKASVAASVEVSVSNGTELKITDLQAKMESDECVITWKTSVMPSAKGKIVFWSGNQPNLLDKSFIEKDLLKGFLHKFAIKATEMPKEFVKIRLSYVISEDAGAYSDLLAKDIAGFKESGK